MANYVWNRVICSKDTLNRYFIDPTPLGEEYIVDSPYISFNRLFDVKSLNEYEESYGVHIYYGFSFLCVERADNLIEIKFSTRWWYPIQAILKALELAHDTVWYAVEENHVYVSKFIWEEKCCEYITPLSDEYFDWDEANDDFVTNLENSDDSVWYYLERKRPTWKLWESSDNFKRYLDWEAYNIEMPDL